MTPTTDHILFNTLAFAVASILSIGAVKGRISFSDYWLLKEKRNKLELRVLNLEKDILHLNQEVDRISKSKDYARKILKEKYHLLEKDERIIFFAD